MQNLKNKEEKQFNAIFNFVSEQRFSFASSYEIALLLEKEIKSFREGDLVKAFALEMAEAFGEKSV